MSENRNDSPFFGPRQPSGAAPDASPADREAYARAVRDAGYPPIFGGGAAPLPDQPVGLAPPAAGLASGQPPTSWSPDLPAGSVLPLGQPGFAPPLGQPDFASPLGQPGFAPPAAGFVPPLDPQLYDHSLQVGGPVLPPDYLRRAPAGRRVLLAALGTLLLVELGILALYVARFGADASLSRMISVVISVVISATLYSGSAWAYSVSLISLVIGFIFGLGVGIPLLDQGLVGVALIGLSVIYGIVAAVLAFSPSVRDFLESQRLREYPGAGGSL